jgi:hypothetical protein
MVYEELEHRLLIFGLSDFRLLSGWNLQNDRRLVGRLDVQQRARRVSGRGATTNQSTRPLDPTFLRKTATEDRRCG